MNNVSKSDQSELLRESCQKHGLEPQVAAELVKIGKRLQHMDRRHGIYETLKRCILDGINTTEERSDGQ